MKRYPSNDLNQIASEIHCETLFGDRSVYWSRDERVVMTTPLNGITDNRLRNDKKYVHICQYNKHAKLSWIREDLYSELGLLLNNPRIQSCLGSKAGEIRQAVNAE